MKNQSRYSDYLDLINLIVVRWISEMMKIEVFVIFKKATLSGEFGRSITNFERHHQQWILSSPIENINYISKWSFADEG